MQVIFFPEINLTSIAQYASDMHTRGHLLENPLEEGTNRSEMKDRFGSL